MRALCTLLLLLAGCGYLPRDADETSDRVARSKIIRVGIAGPVSGAKPFLAALTRATGATPRLEAGSLEPLLAKLDDDRLELVIAPFAKDTMWAERVALGPPLDGSAPGDTAIAIRAAARNGENRWIMTAERAAREGARR